MLFDGIGVLTGTFARLDREQLTLIVPLIERRVLIETFVA